MIKNYYLGYLNILKIIMIKEIYKRKNEAL